MAGARYRIALLTVLCFAAPACHPPAVVPLADGEVLTHLGATSVILSLIPAEPVEILVEYGPADGESTQRTSAARVEAEDTAVFRLEGLEPGRTYRYRVRSRVEAAKVFVARPEHRFTTLREPGQPVRFGFSTDSHVYQSWSLDRCGARGDGLARFEGTLANIRRSELDFLILGGDEAQTHCERCRECRVDGESAGKNTVRTAREAQLRYRVMRRAYEPLAGDLPLFQVLGNHDGEAGFGRSRSQCGHRRDTPELSRLARLAHFPVPRSGLDGHPEGSYYAFESGDALFVILDVMRFTTVLPAKVEDWTLGEEQLSWLERTLAGSSRRWKFLFAHHLVGGSDLKNCYTYGRGGIRSTVDGMPTGRFRGEQARIQDLMRKHGAQVFFSGHDHVFAAGRKDGALYVVGGQGAGIERSSWTEDADFAAAYDYDLDGIPDFLTDKGFVRVTVEGVRRARIEYVKTAPDDRSENGRVLYQTTIE